jgi:hypothetical protein
MDSVLKWAALQDAKDADVTAWQQSIVDNERCLTVATLATLRLHSVAPASPPLWSLLTMVLLVCAVMLLLVSQARPNVGRLRLLGRGSRAICLPLAEAIPGHDAQEHDGAHNHEHEGQHRELVALSTDALDLPNDAFIAAQPVSQTVATTDTPPILATARLARLATSRHRHTALRQLILATPTLVLLISLHRLRSIAGLGGRLWRAHQGRTEERRPQEGQHHKRSTLLPSSQLATEHRSRAAPPRPGAGPAAVFATSCDR